MIESATVFILGAGAHVSFGFPVGERLKSDIATLVEPHENRAPNENDFWVQASSRFRDVISFDRCKAFALALQNAGQPSIDAFLNSNRHREGFEAIGKAAIAKLLLESEKNARFGGDDNWLDYLFQRMIEGVTTIQDFTSANRVSFVTFNYDRFLEHFLYVRILNSFGVSEDDALEALKSIPIEHVYGALGQYSNSDGLGGIDWVKASTGIRTIYDSNHDKKTLESIMGVLSKAQRICLLGFGFHQENIDILDLQNHARSCPNPLHCTRFGLTDTEWERAKRLLEPAATISGSQFEQCRQSLRNLPVF